MAPDLAVRHLTDAACLILALAPASADPNSWNHSTASMAFLDATCNFSETVAKMPRGTLFWESIL